MASPTKVWLWLMSSAIVWSSAVIAAEPYEPLGRMIWSGPQLLHIHCTGTGQPVVVLEAGLGGSSLEWTVVQSRLSQFTRVCSYDRAGMGWSQSSKPKRTSGQIARELEELLRNAKEPGPFVLVGHSYGAYSVQLFARTFPVQTAALVFIDASHPDQIERYAAPPLLANIAPKGRLTILAKARVPEGLFGDLRGLSQNFARTHKVRHTVSRELENFRHSAAEIKLAEALPIVPEIVLSRGMQTWPPGKRGEQMEALWQQLQTELTQASPISGQIIALKSGHYIHLDQPDLVVSAILAAAESTKISGSIQQRMVLFDALQTIDHAHSGDARVVLPVTPESAQTR